MTRGVDLDFTPELLLKPNGKGPPQAPNNQPAQEKGSESVSREAKICLI